MPDALETLPAADGQTLTEFRDALHGNCFACGQGLFRLEFSVSPQGGIQAEFVPASFFSGYEGTMHGGALALFCDQAAACCMFAHGRAAVTARLDLRYRASVRPEQGLRLRAWVVEIREPLYRVELEVEQDGRRVLSGRAEMWRRDTGELIGGISAAEKKDPVLPAEGAGVS